MRTIVVMVSLTLLTACSSPQPRATPSVSQYRQAAQQMYVLGLCNETGFMGAGIMREGAGYIADNYLGGQFSQPVLEAALREEHVRVDVGEEDVAKLRHATGLTKEEKEGRRQFKALCRNYAQSVAGERQRRQRITQQNARQQQEAINSMAQQLSDMGQMMLDGGNNAMRNSQSLAPGPQPSFGLPSTGYSHSLINSPSGLRQRHCTDTSSGMQYCFE